MTIGAGSLEQEVASQAKALDQLFADNPEAHEYLERLEGLVGEQQIPPAENIGEEVERFLRNQRGGEGPTPFSP